MRILEVMCCKVYTSFTSSHFTVQTLQGKRLSVRQTWRCLQWSDQRWRFQMETMIIIMVTMIKIGTDLSRGRAELNPIFRHLCGGLLWFHIGCMFFEGTAGGHVSKYDSIEAGNAVNDGNWRANVIINVRLANVIIVVISWGENLVTMRLRNGATCIHLISLQFNYWNTHTEHFHTLHI